MQTPLERQIGAVYPLAHEIQSALDGAVFPLSRSEIVLIASENEAPTTLITLLQRLADRSYASLDEIDRALEES